MLESSKKTTGLHHFFQFAALAKMRSCPSGQGEDTEMSPLHSQLPAMPCPVLSAHTCSSPTQPELPGGVLQFCPNSGLVGIWKPVQQTPPPHWFSQRGLSQALRVPGHSQTWEGLGFIFLQLGQGKDSCSSGELCSEFGITFVSLGFPSAPTSCKQQSSRTSGGSLVQSSRSRRPGRKGSALLPRGVLKGHKEPSGTEG